MLSCPVLYYPAQCVIPTAGACDVHDAQELSRLGMPEFPLQLYTSSDLAVQGFSLKCFHVLFFFLENEQLQDVQSRKLLCSGFLSHPYFLVLSLKYLWRCKAQYCQID